MEKPRPGSGMCAEQIEAELRKLVAQITPGIDPVLDSYRASDIGDSSYSTTLNRQVRAFLLFQSYAVTGTRFLDWGCRHAWEACMIRMVNERATIKGCDITPEMAETTKQFSRMDYTQLDHAFRLPYADDSFDCVISSGVLEHVPVQNASLLELNRVIEPDGYLVITFLPNKLSYTEFACRHIFKEWFHRRLYSVPQLKRLLFENGFEPLTIGYHQVLPSLTAGHRMLRWSWMGAAGRQLFKLDSVAENIWPLKLFSANLYAIARKRNYM